MGQCSDELFIYLLLYSCIISFTDGLLSLFLNLLSFCDVNSDSCILKGFSMFIQKRDYSGIDPIVSIILGTIFNRPRPNFSGGNRLPKISVKLRRMVSRFNEPMILSQKFFS